MQLKIDCVIWLIVLALKLLNLIPSLQIYRTLWDLFYYLATPRINILSQGLNFWLFALLIIYFLSEFLFHHVKVHVTKLNYLLQFLLKKLWIVTWFFHWQLRRVLIYFNFLIPQILIILIIINSFIFKMSTYLNHFRHSLITLIIDILNCNRFFILQTLLIFANLLLRTKFFSAVSPTFPIIVTFIDLKFL